MGADDFTGRAKAYEEARPGYPYKVMEYIRSISPQDAIFADIGAGTGKLTVLLAQRGYEIFAVEPNDDMRGFLRENLAPFTKVNIIDGAAEATTLPESCVDVITSAQSLNWFDIDAFRTECGRIGKPGFLVIVVYNYIPAEDHGSPSRYEKSTEALFNNPVIREFSNPIRFTRKKWLLYISSMAGVPQPTDPGYEMYFSEMNEKFYRESAAGILRLDMVTKVYCERLRAML